MNKEKKSPDWYDESKLERIRYEHDETGWAVNMGDGTYRLANTPIRGMVGEQQAHVPQWGDLVKLKPNNGHDSWVEVVEKHEERR